ncbi:MAG: hypothetical protein ACXWC7_14660 [Chitinophagaceae bacterium]
MMNKAGSMKEKLGQLASELEGELYDDITIRTLYATDASAYREMPLAVAVPRSVDDIKKLIHFAKTEKTSLIPGQPAHHWRARWWVMESLPMYLNILHR